MTSAAARWSGPLLAVGFALLLVGRGIDLWWHATHPGFETAADQVRAHAAVWVGVLAMLAAAVAALTAGRGTGGHPVILGGALFYAGVAAWHFWEHTRDRDPDLPHVLLLAANILLIAGAAWVAADRLRSRRGRLRSGG